MRSAWGRVACFASIVAIGAAAIACGGEGGGEDAGAVDAFRPPEDAALDAPVDRDASDDAAVAIDASLLDACTGETDAALCAAASAECGSITAADRCGAERAIDCGGCTIAETCGGRAMPNRCVNEHWDIETIDDVGDPGRALSMVIDASDRPWVAYRADESDTLRVAHLEGGAWVVEELDDGPLVAVDTAIAIDPSGGVHVAVPGPVRGGTASYAELWSRGASGTWTMRSTVSGSSTAVGLAFDALGRAQICAYDPPASGFGGFLVHVGEQAGGTFSSATIDGSVGSSTSDVGRDCSIAVDPSGSLHAAYRDLQFGRLKYATRAGASAWVASVIDEPSGDFAGTDAFMALDPDGVPEVVYRARVVGTPEIRWARRSASGWAIEVADDDAGAIANLPHLAHEADGTAHVSSFDSREPGILHHSVRDGSGWTHEVVDVVGTGTGGDNAIAIDSGDVVHVVYYDAIGSRLRYARRVP